MNMRIIAIVCLLLTAVSSWAGTLRDNFEDGNLWEWNQLIPIGAHIADDAKPGKWWVDDGEVWFESVEAPSGITIGDLDWDDYEIEVDAKIVKHSISMHTEGIGIIARRTNEGQYAFIIGTGEMPKVVYAARFEGNDATIHDIIWKQWNWELDRWYRLKLVASGNRFSFYVDGRLALEYANDMYPTGGVGLVGTYTNTNARFDNFSITGPDVPDAIVNTRAANISREKLTTTWGQIKRPK